MNKLKFLDCVEGGAGTCRNKLLFEIQEENVNRLENRCNDLEDDYAISNREL